MGKETLKLMTDKITNDVVKNIVGDKICPKQLKNANDKFNYKVAYTTADRILDDTSKKVVKIIAKERMDFAEQKRKTKLLKIEKTLDFKTRKQIFLIWCRKTQKIL